MIKGPIPRIGGGLSITEALVKDIKKPFQDTLPALKVAMLAKSTGGR